MTTYKMIDIEGVAKLTPKSWKKRASRFCRSAEESSYRSGRAELEEPRVFPES